MFDIKFKFHGNSRLGQGTANGFNWFSNPLEGCRAVQWNAKRWPEIRIWVRGSNLKFIDAVFVHRYIIGGIKGNSFGTSIYVKLCSSIGVSINNYISTRILLFPVRLVASYSAVLYPDDGGGKANKNNNFSSLIWLCFYMFLRTHPILLKDIMSLWTRELVFTTHFL